MGTKYFFQLLVIFIIGISGTTSFILNHSPDDSKQLQAPFSGLEEARDAVRALKKEGKLPPEDLVVYIKEGIYFIDKTFTLTSEDSGTDSAKIIYKPYQNGEVHFIGGKIITGFERLQNNNALSRINPQYHDSIYQINLKQLGIEEFGTIKPTGFGRKIQPTGLELFFNNEPMTLARFPNQQWSRIDSVPQSGTLMERGLERIKRSGVPLGRHYGRFTYRGDRPNAWQKNKDIWLHGYWTHDWADSYVLVDRIDTLKREFILAAPHGAYGYTKKQKYYAFNILEELDTPGEWYLDRTEGMLYFWPPSSLEEGTAYVSMLEEPMIGMNNVSHIRLEGFTFEGMRGAGIVMEGGENNVIAGCTIRNVGTRGITIEGGSDNGVTSCDIYNIGDEGMILSGGNRETLAPANHYATNNHIYNYSRINSTVRAAIQLEGVGCRVTHNHIHDAPHTGVVFDGNDHLLEYNEIHDIAKETGDVGAFYIGRDWTKRGNIIRYNYFHHLHAPGAHGLNAVYLDDGASGTAIYGNLFYRVDRGVLIGGGHDNIVKNNIFVRCKNAAIYLDARGMTWAKSYIEKEGGWQMYKKLESVHYDHSPYSEKYPELKSMIEGKNPAEPSGNAAQNNICYGNWLLLRDGGKMHHLPRIQNYIVDEVPDYIDVETGKIYPKKAQLRKIDFQKIPLDSIGLYKNEYRNSL